MKCVIVSARNIIQALRQRKNVRTMFKKSRKEGRRRPSEIPSVLTLLVFSNKRGKKNAALTAPQITNVQLAPCQKPLKRKIGLKKSGFMINILG